MAIGFVTAFPLSLALMFGIRDIDAVLDSSLPSAEIFNQITGSKGLTTFMTCWVIVVYYCVQTPTKSNLLLTFLVALTSQWVTAGRMTWAFARDVRWTRCLSNHLMLLTYSTAARNTILCLLFRSQPVARFPCPPNHPFRLLLLRLRPPLPRQYDRIQLHRDGCRSLPRKAENCSYYKLFHQCARKNRSSNQFPFNQNITYAIPQA